jgi:hypothetical protein
MATKEDIIPVGKLCFETSTNKTNRCPYWKWWNGTGYCGYLDEEIELLYDQVKKCGLNVDKKETT